MANPATPAGLSFADVNMGSMGADLNTVLNPYAGFSQMPRSGTENMMPSQVDTAVLGRELVKQSQFTMPEIKRPPVVAYSPSNKTLFVNGAQFAADDDALALQTETLLSRPGVGMPQGGDWVQLDPSAYGQYLNTIKNPGLGKLAKKNFGIGLDNMQMLAGRGLQFLGAEETGQRIVDAQVGTDTMRGDLQKSSPYIREFSDVKDANTAIDWLVATIAQQGPNILESIATAAAGFAVGTATGGPLAGGGAALAGLAGKETFKQSVLAAIKKKAAGEVLDAVETKLLREAAGIAGATIFTTAQNYATGVADIYGEQRDQGQDNRLSALASAVPYAALESLPEFVLAARLFGTGGIAKQTGRALKDIQGETMLGTAALRGGELLKRAGKGFVVGGTAEGATELGQESLLIANTGQDFGDPNVQKRLMESFAAGFGTGGVLGAAANLRRGPLTKEPTNLLNPSQTTEPPAPSTALAIIPPPPGAPVGGPTQTGGMGARPDFVAGADGVRPSVPTDRIFTGQVAPGQFGGAQGVLDLGGATIGELQQRSNQTGELAPRMVWNPQTQQYEQQAVTAPPSDRMALPAPQAPVDPRQMALQFAPPAPSGVGFTDAQPAFNPAMAQQLQAAIQQRQIQEAYAQRMAQEQAQREADMNRLAIQAQNQRQLDFAAQQQQQPVTQQQLPMRPLPVRQPQQLSLFNRRQAPVPSRAEGLRRGVGTQVPAPAPVVQGTPTPGQFQRAGQLSLFTQQGQPSVAALKSAGTRQAVPTPTVQQGATQIPPTGAPVTAVTATKAKAAVLKKGKANATQKGKQQQDSVSQRQQDNAGVQGGGQTGNQPTTQVKGGGTQASGGGKSLKRGKKQEEVVAAPVVTAKQEAPKPPTPPKGGKKKLAKGAEKKPEAKAKATPAKAAQLQKGPSGLAAMVGQLLGTTQQPAVVESKAKKGVQEASEETKAANEELDMAIETIETTKSPAAYVEALFEIVSAYALTSNVKAYLRTASERFLQDGGIPQRDFIAALREVALNEESIGPKTRLYSLLADHGLLNDANIQALIRQPGAKVKQEAVVDKPVNTQTENLGEIRMAELINNRNGYLNKAQLRRAALILYVDVDDDNFNVSGRGRIKDFFTADGEPIIVQVPGTSNFVLATKEEGKMSKEEFAEKHKDARQAMRDLEAEETQTTLDDLQYDPLYDNARSDRGDLEFYRVDGRPTEPMKVGPLRLFAARVVSKFARKPTVNVFANLADMQKANPSLFAAAAKARKEGDIEHVNAAGMAWGNNVVLFADFIESEQQARFIIAHETLGHVGFRGLFNDRALNAILKLVADSDPQLKYAAEVYAAGRGVSFLEAVEEVLADRAAAVDTNTLLRFWSWVKDQLNKIGLKFNDDAARYLIGLSRKYVRQGTGRSEVNLSGLFKEIDQSLLNDQSNLEVLRFAAMAPQGSMTLAMGNINRNAAMHGQLSRAVSDLIEAKERTAEARKQAKGLWKNTQNVAQSILDGVQTMDNLARKSKGFSKIFELLQLKGAKQNQYKQKYADGTATAHKAKFLGLGEGADIEQQVRAGELLAYGSLFKMNSISDSQLDKMDNPVFFDPDSGILDVNIDAFRALVDAGRLSVEDFKKGFEVQQGTKEVPMTEEHRQELAAERDLAITKLEAARDKAFARVDKKIAAETDEDMKAELALERKRDEKKFNQDIEQTKRLYTKRMKEPMYEVPNMAPTPEWFKDLTEDSVEWKMYNEFAETMAMSHIDVLRSKYIGAVYEQKRAISAGVRGAFKKSTPLTDVERRFIEDATGMFDEMRMKGAEFQGNRLKLLATSEKDALEWLRMKFARAFYTDLALNDLKTMMPGYTPAQVESLVKSMRAKLQTQIDPEVDPIKNSSIWALEHRIEERSMFAASINDDQLYAKRSIAGAYVPLTREGDWQVRVQAFTTDKDGTKYPVKLTDGQQNSLAFYKTGTQKDAEQYQEELNAMLNGEYEMRDEKGNLQKVRLEAVASVTRQTPDLVDVLHYDEVMYSLSRLGIQLSPEVRQVLVQKVSGQNSRARANLQRAGVPGWDKDIVRSSSAFLEQQAYVAANKEYRHRFDEVLDDNDNWSDNPERLATLKAKWESATGEAKEVAAREYFQEKFFQDNVVEYTKDGRRIERGLYYNERAKSMLAWMDSTGDIVHADDIWSNNEWSVATRTWAALAQLGGSIATGITQVLSLPTNSWAYLSSFNPKTGFGVGLGAGKAGKLLTQFLMSTANPKYADLAWLEARLQEFEVAEKNGAKYTKDGLTGSELRFLKDMTEQQRLDAASFNAMTGTSKGRKMTGNPTFQKIIQGWMFPFSYSEQVNRRVTLLAAYRGEYERQMATHGDPSIADVKAREVSTKALDATQGDYAQYNRPAFFRGGVQAFIYMYKQYPIMMIQLLKNMNYEGRIIMIGSLLLLSGVRGLPGADDLLDVLDAICQRLGLKIGSVEKEFARLTADVFGAELASEINPIVMRGLFDRMTGWSFSNRLGLGDIIPGTGILKPSATKDEILREVENLAGAPTSFIVGVLNWGGSTLPAVVTGRQSPIELLRDNPVRAFKNVGDAWKYADTGAILDNKGYVVAKNVSTWELLGKAMGFYPSRAQMQMDWMSADRQEQAYMSMIKTELTREGVAARLENDTERLAQVRKFVADWNEDTKGTRLEMRNFDRGLTQAYREASKPLAIRALKSSAKGGRMEAKDMLRLYGVDEETLAGIPD
jgi:hypothetical protein